MRDVNSCGLGKENPDILLEPRDSPLQLIQGTKPMTFLRRTPGTSMHLQVGRNFETLRCFVWFKEKLKGTKTCGKRSFLCVERPANKLSHYFVNY